MHKFNMVHCEHFFRQSLLITFVCLLSLAAQANKCFNRRVQAFKLAGVYDKTARHLRKLKPEDMRSSSKCSKAVAVANHCREAVGA